MAKPWKDNSRKRRSNGWCWSFPQNQFLQLPAHFLLHQNVAINIFLNLVFLAIKAQVERNNIINYFSKTKNFWIPIEKILKKKVEKVPTWEDSQISVLLISIRTFCSSSINLGNNWCRIQFVLMALSHFNLLKHNKLYHLNDLLFFFLLSYWPVDDRAHNPDEMKW